MPIENLLLWIGLALVAVIAVAFLWRLGKNHTSDLNSRDFQERLEEGVGDPLAEVSVEPSFREGSKAGLADMPLSQDGDPQLGEPGEEQKAADQPVQEELDFSSMEAVVPLPKGRSAPDIDSGIEAVVNFVPKEGSFDQARMRSLERRVAESRYHDLIRVDYQNAATGRWSHQSQGMNGSSQIYMTMMLANRGRVLDELTASDFLQLADHIAIEINADAALPDSQMMLESAGRIAEVIAHYDNALSMKIAAAEDFDQSAVKAAATACGFSYKGDHYDRCFAGTEVPVMQLWPSKQLPNEMELVLDIPLTSPAANPLGDFFAAGNDLCCRLGAVLADPVGQPIGSPMAALISRQLAGIYEQMAASGVPAGSQRARRIFSRI